MGLLTPAHYGVCDSGAEGHSLPLFPVQLCFKLLLHSSAPRTGLGPEAPFSSFSSFCVFVTPAGGSERDRRASLDVRGMSARSPQKEKQLGASGELSLS